MFTSWEFFFSEGWGTNPTVDITVTPSVTRVSRVVGKDITTFSFESPTRFVAYQLRAVPASDSLVSTGQLLESGGDGDAEEQIDVNVTDDELVDAGLSDGTHRVKVFVQDYSSQWST